MIAVDASVVVAGLSPWHERHDDCRSVLDQRPHIVGHVLVEAFSVFDQAAVRPVPGAGAIGVAVVDGQLRSAAADPEQRHSLACFVAELPDWHVRGGGVDDALIAATVREAGATRSRWMTERADASRGGCRRRSHLNCGAS